MRTISASKVGLAGILALLAVLLGCVGSASAIQVQPHHFSFQFTGEGSTGGPLSPFGLDTIGIDPGDGTVYVLETEGIKKFDASGAPQPFSDPSLGGGTVIPIPPVFGETFDLSVDGAGTIYFANGWDGKIHKYAKSGAEAGSPFPIGDLTTSPRGIAVRPDGKFWVSQDVFEKNKVILYNADGTASETAIPLEEAGPLALDGQGNLYVVYAVNGCCSGSGRVVGKFDPEGHFLYQVDPGPASDIAVDQTTGDLFVNHGQFGGMDITEYNSSGTPIDRFGGPEPAAEYEGLNNFARSLAVNQQTHDVYVMNQNQQCDVGNSGCEFSERHPHIDVFAPGSAITIPTVALESPVLHPTEVTLRGTVDPDGGGATTDCHFEWASQSQWQSEHTYANSTPCTPGGPFSGSGVNQVSATLTGLTQGTRYHYRLVSNNATGEANGLDARTADATFRPQGPPIVVDEFVSGVNTDNLDLNADVEPNGGETTYQIEWGADETYGNVLPVQGANVNAILGVERVTQHLSGLTPGATYHYRFVFTNQAGTVPGQDREFTTFARPPGTDTCANAHVRQQTGASLLLDCRAYELVSAANAGGYDVESDIIPGQEPPEAFPRATDRILYSLHRGTIPGIAGNPTNYGTDPYVAERGANGWTTRYVGLPANGMPSTLPFGSPLLGADLNLSTFAFGENGNGTPICDPCFSDGSINIPLRHGDAPIAKGMAGSLNPAADPAVGSVREPVSGDGTHLIFGTTAKFESDGNSNGDVTIYDRNLSNGVTHVVSKTPGGATVTGTGIAELAVSDDGSHVLIGQLVSSDPTTGNQYWHLYMNVGDAGSSIDLTPSSPAGVLYDGMTADGSRVYFSAASAGLGESDSSIDLYRADVGATSATTSRVSTGSGGSGDTDSCTPVLHWNTATGADNCDVVAFAGGAGVAAGDGTVFFLSPEELDGSGTADEPNLFVARPGSAPHFVATLDPGNPAIHDAVYDNEVHSYGDFQVTPSGRFAAFATTAPVTEFTTFDHSEIYRYDTDSDAVVCASCPPTQALPTTQTFLTPHGLNLSDDGRVFFTSSEPLALRDTNNLADAYEWENGTVELISTGSSEADSGIVTASADGKNAFFFTRQTLVAQDLNGNAVKIYDARTEGGFPFIAPPDPCKASDECHGPGTQAAPEPVINTVTGPGNVKHPSKKPHCRRGFKKKKRRCVRVHHRKHHRHATRHHG
ncbi:MAG TPA: hypothetical protein VHQ97_04975 [Solirubrobacterales bacterium]|nr:hypothetical protein [Solirubrobacterales bacterium]